MIIQIRDRDTYILIMYLNEAIETINDRGMYHISRKYINDIEYLDIQKNGSHYKSIEMNNLGKIKSILTYMTRNIMCKFEDYAQNTYLNRNIFKDDEL